MSSLCGPVVDDVRVWFSGSCKIGFGAWFCFFCVCFRHGLGFCKAGFMC